VDLVVVEAVVAVEAVFATTATKKVILPENAQRVLLDPIRRSISKLPQKKWKQWWLWKIPILK
jgi:hypothetical protein